MLNSAKNWQSFVPCDLRIWWMTLKNNSSPLLCYFKLCASFHNHRCIKTWVTVRKRPIWVEIGDFLSREIVKFDRWSRKTIGHLFYATSSFVHHSVSICKFELELRSGNVRTGAKYVFTSATLTFDLWPWPFAWTSLLSMVITPENFMMIQWKEHSEKGLTDRRTDRRTDGRTDRSVLRAAWSQLKMSASKLL